MDILEYATTSTRVALSLDELLMLNNALNEVTNGVHLDDWEFETRLGYPRVEVRTLLHAVSDLIDRMNLQGGPPSSAGDR